SMTKVVTVPPLIVVLGVTTGAIVATTTGLLLTPSVVTVAVSGPAVGGDVNVTVREVAVADVTVPVPEDNTAWLFAAIGSKPVPVRVKLVALAATAVVLAVGLACTSTAPMSTPVPKSRARPRWSVVRVESTESEPALSAGLPAKRDIVCVG